MAEGVRRLLEGQVAIVTGGARGIGRAMGVRLAAEGARIVIADIGDGATAPLEDVAPQAQSTVVCDVTSERAVEELFERAIDRFGRVDIVINNAGLTRDAFAHRMPLEAFRQVIDVHLQGTWLMTRAALTHMRGREGGGSIVNVSSISGKIGNMGQTNYSAAKAGVVGLTKAAAKEGARYGIRVNAIQPGLIRTPMTDAMPADLLADRVADIPLGRLGEPQEVAAVALFLASGLSSYVTGAVVEVSGGRGM